MGNVTHSGSCDTRSSVFSIEPGSNLQKTPTSAECEKPRHGRRARGQNEPSRGKTGEERRASPARWKGQEYENFCCFSMGVGPESAGRYQRKTSGSVTISRRLARPSIYTRPRHRERTGGGGLNELPDRSAGSLKARRPTEVAIDRSAWSTAGRQEAQESGFRLFSVFSRRRTPVWFGKDRLGSTSASALRRF